MYLSTYNYKKEKPWNKHIYASLPELRKKSPFGQYNLLSATSDELILACAVQTFRLCFRHAFLCTASVTNIVKNATRKAP